MQANDGRRPLARLLMTKDIGAIPMDKALKRTAQLADLSSQLDSAEGTQLALAWCDLLEKSACDARYGLFRNLIFESKARGVVPCDHRRAATSLAKTLTSMESPTFCEAAR
jgi:hypothetical protein